MLLILSTSLSHLLTEEPANDSYVKFITWPPLSNVTRTTRTRTSSGIVTLPILHLSFIPSHLVRKICTK